MFDKYPYTDFHEMNLDWIIREMKQLVEDWEGFSGRVSAEAHEATEPEVTVSGDLKEGLNFDFGLVQGPRGTTGAQGPQGEQGPAGEGLQILDTYPTLTALQAAHPTGSPGDAYLVGSGGVFTLYIWSVSGSVWTDAGTLSSPSPSNVSPAMDGTASAGSSTLYSRGDHVHPSDTSKLDKSATDGVYAVESGAQIMLNVSDNAQADAIVKYDSVGDLNAANLNASGNVNAVDETLSGDLTVGGDAAVTGELSADTINVTNSAILNSAMLEAEVNGTNAYKPLARINNIDPLAINYDAQNIPSIRMNMVEYAQDGTRNTVQPEVFFTSAFGINQVDYAQTRIDLKPASASKLGGVKIGSGITVAADGTISASGSTHAFELLWTNASPGSNFAAQTVSLDLSDYDVVLIRTEIATSGTPIYIDHVLVIDGSTYMMHSCFYNINFRNVTVSSTGLTFEGGFTRTQFNQATPTASDSALVPVNIYGIKY